MGKKHKHPEHENLERWLVSYADFITLLFATFVVLYALSQADITKLREASVSIRQAFHSSKPSIHKQSGGGGGALKGDSNPHILKDFGNSIMDKINPRYPPNENQKGVSKPIEEAVKAANQEIAKQTPSPPGTPKDSDSQKNPTETPPAQVVLQERGVLIRFASSLFFASGEAGLKPSAFKILDTVAPLLISSGSIIHVEGHTDDHPIASAIFPSNWELSCARASSVVRYFVTRHHLSPQNMAAVGYGETRPLATNGTPHGRQENRRVDIVILSSQAAGESDAGAAQKTENVILSEESD
jgi:chemotaxis protein MotB